MRLWFRWLLGAAMFLLVGVAPAAAMPPPAPSQPAPSPPAEPRTITVAVSPVSPFVMDVSGERAGFTIDLWQGIGDRLGWNIEYLDFPDVRSQLQAVADGRADVAAGALSLTSERERRFDFSQPSLDAGLQIMVPERIVATARPSLSTFFGLVLSTTMLAWLFASLVISVLPAHILWLIERRHETSGVARSYFPGIFQAFAWSVGSLVGAGGAAPRQWIARAVAILWGFISIVFVSFYTANLTAAITVARLEAEVSGPADLYGRSVATVADSTAASFLRSIGVDFTTFATIEDCYNALLNHGYDAVVFDAPVLRYFVARQGDGAALMAGPVFQQENYGFLFPIGSELRKPVDQALLTLREDGTYGLTEEKWFGDDVSTSTADAK